MMSASKFVRFLCDRCELPYDEYKRESTRATDDKVKLWVDTLSLPRVPSAPNLVEAALVQGLEGQCLEFVGDGFLRVLQAVHLIEALPDGHIRYKESAHASMMHAIERNPFLARRLVRLVGRDGVGLDRKLKTSHFEVLCSIEKSHRLLPFADERFFEENLKEDLSVENGPSRHKMLADLLESLLGAVVLQEGVGLEGAQSIFARAVLPPPHMIAEIDLFESDSERLPWRVGQGHDATWSKQHQILNEKLIRS